MSRSRPTIALLAIAVVAISLGGMDGATPAGATYPGEPGRVAYTESSERPNGHAAEIYTMNPDGSDRKRITFDGGIFIKEFYPGDPEYAYSTYTASSSPKWSPDGTQIGFLHHAADDTFEVRVLDPVSGHMEVLFDNWHATMISWSPNGQRIAYGDESGVWTANTDGTNATLIATPSIGQPLNGPTTPSSITSVAWSPDGKRIAFEEWTGGGYVAGFSFVGVINADGTGRRSFACTIGISGLLDTLDWAPDGSVLLCGEMNGPMLTIEPDGSHLSVVGQGDRPVWSPDGSVILHGSGVLWEDTRELWSYDIASDTRKRLLEEFWGYDLSWQPTSLLPQPVGLVDPLSGIWRVAGTDGVARVFYYGNPGDYPIMGDWNCDGVDTPGLYRQSDGYVYLRNSNTQGNANIRFYFGNPGDVPIAGDFNGDGCDTVSIYRQTEGRVYIINKLGQNDGGLGAADYSYYFGNPGDKPFVGDFNGDGIDTVGLHRESTGLVYFRNSNTQGNAEFEFYFGNPADRLIAGDWNGDGADSPAIYRPSDRTFYFRYTNTQGNADEQFLWGWPHWVPVAGGAG